MNQTPTPDQPIKRARLSQKLIWMLFSISLVVSTLMAGLQLTIDYERTKQSIESDILYSINTLGPILALQMWNFEEAGFSSSISALENNKYISGARLFNDLNEELVTSGDVPEKVRYRSNERFNNVYSEIEIRDVSDEALKKHVEYQFDIFHRIQGKEFKVGYVQTYSNGRVIFNELSWEMLSTAILTLIQVTAVSVVFYFLILKFIANPVAVLADILKKVDPDSTPSDEVRSKTNYISRRGDEIGELFRSYISLNRELVAKSVQVKRHQLDLEAEVSNRTQDLENTMKELEKTNQYKSQFLANMSHEIRTPMNGILGMVNLLQDTKLNDEQKHYLKTIEVSGNALTTIINDILDFSKIEAGKLDLEVIEFDLESLLSECISLFTQQATSKKIVFTYYINPDVPLKLLGDPTRLSQVLMNFLSNAFKFTDEGQILVEVSQTGLESNQTHLQFEISDTGQGIAKESQQKLFNAFTQADTSTTRTHGGTGLGLAICHRLVGLMGGSIKVNSELGEGSTFIFDANFEYLEQVNNLEAADIENGEILFICQNSRLPEILSATAEKSGFTSTIVHRMDQALSSIQLNAYDCLVCEDEFNTKTLLSCLSKKTNKPIPLIIISWATKDSARHNEEHVRYIDMPVTPLSFSSEIKKVLFHTHQTIQTSEEKSILPDLSKLHILIAEDNHVNQMVVKGLLKKMNVTPVFCGNGQEAINWYQNSKFDVILMDCEMPIVDGYQATRTIRALENEINKPITIIGLSAHALPEQKNRALELGMDNYLTKPIEFETLKVALENCLSNESH